MVVLDLDELVTVVSNKVDEAEAEGNVVGFNLDGLVTVDLDLVVVLELELHQSRVVWETGVSLGSLVVEGIDVALSPVLPLLLSFNRTWPIFGLDYSWGSEGVFSVVVLELNKLNG